jgi:uncharacterized protein (UPF0210 family)
VGGFGALVQKGLTRSDAVLIKSLPEVLSKTERVCSFLNVGSNVAGLNIDAVNMIGPMLKATAKKSKNAIGCAKFVVLVNAPEDNPFMAGAFHGTGEPDFSLNVGISGPGVVRSVVEKNPDCDFTALSEVIKKTTFKITRAGELIGRELAAAMKVPFGIVDISLASTTAPGDSVARISSISASSGGRARVHLRGGAAHGRRQKRRRHGEREHRRAFGDLHSGERRPGMIEAVRAGALSLDKLESLNVRMLGGARHVRHSGQHPRRNHQCHHRR